jgi:hypothetical protein
VRASTSHDHVTRTVFYSLISQNFSHCRRQGHFEITSTGKHMEIILRFWLREHRNSSGFTHWRRPWRHIHLQTSLHTIRLHFADCYSLVHRLHARPPCRKGSRYVACKGVTMQQMHTPVEACATHRGLKVHCVKRERNGRTDFKELNPSWQATSCSSIQGITCILRNPKKLTQYSQNSAVNP